MSLKNASIVALLAAGLALSGVASVQAAPPTPQTYTTPLGLISGTQSFSYEELSFDVNNTYDYTFSLGSLGTFTLDSFSPEFSDRCPGCAISLSLAGTSQTYTDFSNTINLGQGSYLFEVKGTAFGGSKTGEADIAFTIAAVPEPGEWALLLSGIGLMGFIARRRKGVSAA
ncbi:MAG: FxDxF family PEP-CTERM protein [Hydrogenophilaceae bacterium]